MKADAVTGKFHPVLEGLEDATRIINGIFNVKVTPGSYPFPSPVTLVPTYPDLPMEDVYSRIPDTDIREVYLKESGKGRVVYFPWDIDSSFWKYMTLDHSKLLNNTVRWALNEEPIVKVTGPGLIEVTAWRQKKSMTIHLVNLTNPMMMKGPFRELIPVKSDLSIRLPENVKVTGVHLMMSDQKPIYKINNGNITLSVPELLDHEIVAIDLF